LPFVGSAEALAEGGQHMTVHMALAQEVTPCLNHLRFPIQLLAGKICCISDKNMPVF